MPEWLARAAPRLNVARAPLVAVALFTAARLSPLAGQAPGAGLPAWVGVDTTSRTVTLALEALSGGPDGIATLNGHHHGDLQLIVPVDWTVRWTWTNRDSMRNHSLVVMAEREKLPTEGGRPALENGMTRSVTAGLKPGQRDVTTFLADQPGWFWMLCGVPDHAVRGEWMGLKVDREAVGPGVVLK
jgi:hypothetical protein